MRRIIITMSIMVFVLSLGFVNIYCKQTLHCSWEDSRVPGHYEIETHPFIASIVTSPAHAFITLPRRKPGKTIRVSSVEPTIQACINRVVDGATVIYN